MLFSFTTLLIATAGLSSVTAAPAHEQPSTEILVGPRAAPRYRIQISTVRDDMFPGRINKRFVSNLQDGTFFSASERFAGNFTLSTSGATTSTGLKLFGIDLTKNQITGVDPGFPAMVLDGRDMMTLTGGPDLSGNAFKGAQTANGGRIAAGEVFYATGTTADPTVEAARPAPSNGVVLMNFCDETSNQSNSKVILVSKMKGCGTRKLTARLVRVN